MNESFVMYRSFHEALSQLSREQYGNVMFAINEYALNGTEIELSGIEKAIFLMAKPQLDANEKRKTNGLKGGRPQKTIGLEKGTEKKPMVIENEEKEKPMVLQNVQNEKPNVNVNVNDNANVNSNVNENVCMTGASSEAPSREQKHKYGNYQHVLITDTEKEKLDQEYGRDRVDKAITFLDEYIEMKGYKAKSHYLALKKWVFQAVSEQERRNGQHIPDSVANMEVY